MHLAEAFSKWMKTTGVFYFVNHCAWVVPASQTLHFFGLALLFGMIGLLDLRVLGMGKRLPAAPINRLIPWGVFGFFINVITGFLLYSADPVQYFHNIAFRYKMLFIFLAGVNILAFYATGVFRKVEAMGPGDDAPALAKLIRGVSLFLWIGVMFWGRMLPFIGTAF